MNTRVLITTLTVSFFALSASSQVFAGEILCQDQSGGLNPSFPSDEGAFAVGADRIILDADEVIVSLSWEGIYSTGQDCSGSITEDDFTLTIYEGQLDDGLGPYPDTNNVIYSTEIVPSDLTRTLGGTINAGGLHNYFIYEYTFEESIPLVAGHVYWFEIYNNTPTTNCNWNWLKSDDGDDMGTSGVLVGDIRFYAGSEDFDFTLCLYREDLCGDLDGDGDVDVYDFYIFVGAYGSCGEDVEFVAAADYDGNGCITEQDYPYWLDCYEQSSGQSGFGEDCNANSLPDALDLADGTSADANGNGIPDECELMPGQTRPNPKGEFYQIPVRKTPHAIDPPH